MRRSVRTSVLASTAMAAAAFGAVALAPMASAAPEEPTPPALGSAQPESPNLIVSITAVCDPRDGDLGGDVAALQIDIDNAGTGDASNVTTNFVALPDAPGVFNEKVIKAGEGVTYTVPSRDEVWVNRPAGAAVFSPQIDASYPDNVDFGLLSVDCSPVDEPEE